MPSSPISPNPYSQTAPGAQSKYLPRLVSIAQSDTLGALTRRHVSCATRCNSGLFADPVYSSARPTPSAIQRTCI